MHSSARAIDDGYTPDIQKNTGERKIVRLLPQSWRSISIITAGLGIAACTEGRVWWPGQTAPLRTALVKYDEDHGVARARLLLSTGLFTCDLPDTNRPVAEVHDAYQDLVTGACREGAAHLSVQLLRRSGRDWTGTFDGLSGSRGDTLPLSLNRASDVSWYTVNEAYLIEYANLDRAYVIEDQEMLIDAGDGGEVRIERDHRGLRGHLWFPEPDVSADFHTQVCGEGSTLFDLLEASPVGLCP